VRATRPHVTVIGHHAKEKTKFSNVGRREHVENALNLLAKRFDSCRGEPVSKEIGFLDAKFALQGIDSKTFVLQALADLVESVKVLLPGLRENTNVVNVAFNVLDSTKGLLHNLLRNVRRCTDAHGKAFVAVKTKRGSNG
jgi:hypothetical protein